MDVIEVAQTFLGSPRLEDQFAVSCNRMINRPDLSSGQDARHGRLRVVGRKSVT